MFLLPDYLWEDILCLCHFTAHYDKVVQDPLNIWEDLKQMLPNADPIYLRNQAYGLAISSREEFDKFVSDALEKNDYPTYEDYLKYFSSK